MDGSQMNTTSSQQCLDEAHKSYPGPTASRSHDQESPRDATKNHHRWNLQASVMTIQRRNDCTEQTVTDARDQCESAATVE